MENSFVPLGKLGIMDDDHHQHDEDQEEDTGSLSSLSEDEEEDDGSVNSDGSSSSADLMEDAASSSSSLDSSLSNGPLFEMSSLISQLPFKRGLSKHFEGKSQSFTSLATVKRLEDLMKPERPSNKRRQLKSSKSYGWGLDKSHSRAIAKKSSKGLSSSSSSSFVSSIKRHGSLLGGRAQRSGSLSGQTLLETIG